MVDRKVQELKSDGNKFYAYGDFENAIRCYGRAVSLGISEKANSELIAIVASNMAQACYQMEKYELVLELVDQSLHYNPTFRKSMLRRALANFAIGNREEAERELNELLKDEPDNKTILKALREIHGEERPKTVLLKAYMGHYFRRITINAKPESDFKEMITFRKSFNNSFLRMAFLSWRSSSTLKPFFDGSWLMEVAGKISAIYLPHFFAIKRMKCCKLRTSFVVMNMLSVDAFILLSLFTKASNLTLSFTIDASPIISIFPFKTIHYHSERNLDSNKFAPLHHLQAIAFSSSVLTRLPYYPGVYKLKDTSFPKLDTIVIPRKHAADEELLKLWKKQKWQVKKMIFYFSTPQMTVFENESGIISSSLTEISLPISDATKPLKMFSNKQLKQFRKNLMTLKQVFPNLTTVTGTFSLEFNHTFFDGLFLGIEFKNDLEFLLEKFGSRIKPKWCENFQIYVNVGIHLPDNYKRNKTNMERMKQIFNGFQMEMKDKLKTSALRMAPVKSKFEDFPQFAPIALVEMETEDASFEYSLESR